MSSIFSLLFTASCLNFFFFFLDFWKKTRKRGGLRGRSQQLAEGVGEMPAPFVTSQRADFQNWGFWCTLATQWREAEGVNDDEVFSFPGISPQDRGIDLSNKKPLPHHSWCSLKRVAPAEFHQQELRLKVAGGEG